jgi:uncharacterized phage protein (TIGR02220 family)
MKNTYYFSHDTNASRDEKILFMRVDYGWEGYGWYWAIVETMAEANNYKLKFKNGNPNRVAIAGLSLCHNIPIEELEKFIDDCINKYGLFDTDEEYFWSKTLLKRLSIRDEKSNKLRDAGIKGAKKRWGIDSHPNGEVSSHPNGNERKGKEIKLKERKLNKNKGKNKDSTKYHTIIREQIINYLNTEASKNYKLTTPETIRLINARLKEDYLLDDFKKVIDVKCEEWKGKFTKDGKNMEDWLRPQTLFGNKFESYLNQKINESINNEHRFDFIDEEEKLVE